MVGLWQWQWQWQAEGRLLRGPSQTSQHFVQLAPNGRAEALGSDEAHLRVVALDPLLQLVRVWNPPGENLFTGINEDRPGISKKLVQHIS